MTVWRYIRAFFIALKMTIRGEALPESPYAPLREWMREGIQHIDAVITAADNTGLNRQARQDLVLHFDSRDMNMEIILKAVRHNLTREYPSLLRSRSAHKLAALYAFNLNDRYRVQQLCDADALQTSALQGALTALSVHLEAIPSVETSESSIY